MGPWKWIDPESEKGDLKWKAKAKGFFEDFESGKPGASNGQKLER